MEILDILIYLYGALGIIQLLFYSYFRLNFPKAIPFSRNRDFKKASLIIAFKNESENLRKNLPYLLNQDYPDFEIILVNDHSTDDSLEVLNSFHDNRIRILELENRKGKKAAIEHGINASNHDLLLFTDADCSPCSEQWMKLMLAPLLDNKEIAIGYGGFKKKGSLLNKLQRYENFMNAFQNFSYAEGGHAYMAVGRNLAYKKEIYSKSSAFEKLSHLRGGDDDLLVNEMSKDGNTIAITEASSHTISSAADNWKSYYHQKRRHLEVGKYYRVFDRLKLAIMGLSQLFFNLLFITLLLMGDGLPLILTIFAVKTVLQLLLYVSPMKRLEEIDLWIFIPFLEMIYLPIISCVGLSQYLWKVDRWK